jgi:hypothetical protein
MLKFLTKSFPILLLVALFTISNVSAQPSPKAKDRIMQAKKMKLLEVLDLDEATSEKVLAKVTIWEKKIFERRDAVEDAARELHFSLQGKVSREEIVKKTQAFTNAQDEFMKTVKEKMADMKSILNDVEYAKYILFEDRFAKEIQRMIMKKMKDRRGPDPMDGPPEKNNTRKKK